MGKKNLIKCREMKNHKLVFFSFFLTNRTKIFSKISNLQKIKKSEIKITLKFLKKYHRFATTTSTLITSPKYFANLSNIRPKSRCHFPLETSLIINSKIYLCHTTIIHSCYFLRLFSRSRNSQFSVRPLIAS